ncbi:hypothetical protein Y032_0096g2914 [Ancylostoma ceylanicum]|nr:hypothetical protein Y032_0096g2914 [Ancylostoma ceylanicum]
MAREDVGDPFPGKSTYDASGLEWMRRFSYPSLSEQAISRLSTDEKPPTSPLTHLVVFVHGLEGTCDDLSSYRDIFRIIAGENPGFYYLLSASNHSKTWSDIDEMAENLLSEVQSYVSRYSEPPMRISFVAHSLGGVIVRAAVCRDEAEWLRPRLHCLLTINSPHLGLAYVGKGVNLGIQFMQWWKQSRSMEQLSLKDEVAFYDSFLFRLSQKKTFGLFRRVLLIGTPADMFVPCHSALLAPCKTALKDPSALGSIYRPVTDKGQDRGAGTLVVCCTEAADLLGRDAGKNRYVVIAGAAADNQSAHTAVTPLVYGRLEFSV